MLTRPWPLFSFHDKRRRWQKLRRVATQHFNPPPTSLLPPLLLLARPQHSVIHADARSSQWGFHASAAPPLMVADAWRDMKRVTTQMNIHFNLLRSWKQLRVSRSQRGRSLDRSNRRMWPKLNRTDAPTGLQETVNHSERTQKHCVRMYVCWVLPRQAHVIVYRLCYAYYKLAKYCRQWATIYTANLYCIIMR